MSEDVLMLLSFAASMFLFPVFLLFLSKLLSPSNPSPVKSSTYECAETPIGEGRTQFGIQYFRYAIFFIIFDVFTTFILICATAFTYLENQLLLPIIAFLGVAAVGALCSWRSMGDQQ